MPTVTQAIQNYLNARKAHHNGPDLLERWTPYMETQINVSAGLGEPVADKRNTWTDGLIEWWNIRIPKNADSEPVFRDYNLTWPLDDHAEGIGCTGWDWSARRSRWLGFDFDSITGHAAGVGVSDEDLAKVSHAAQALPYVEVRKSTGGNGLHLYVYFDDAGIPTANHTEHSALGRAILGMMSSETGFDFASQIDVCGSNMWIWHRKMNEKNEGLKLLKSADKVLSLSDLPANWKDHIEVIQRRRAKVRVEGIAEGDLDPFEALANSRRIVPLDDKHKAIRDELQRSGFSCVWVSDHHLLQTHTKALQNLMDDPLKRQQLGLQGFFKTVSQGNDPGKPNCFMFPLDNGGWRVYLFGQGRNEAETWTQDPEGWTNCYFNRQPDLSVASKAMGGLEDPENGGFVFDTASSAMEAAKALGQKVKLPEDMKGREARLKSHKDGRLVIHVQKRDGDEGMKEAGWLAKKDKWVKVFNTQTENKKDDLGFAEYDTILRQLVTPTGEDAGWVVKSNDGGWHRFPTDKVKLMLLTLGNTEADVKLILGGAIRKSWKLVNLPFQPEYPGNRQWNLDSAQFRFQPAKLEGDEVPRHPHWDKILQHCGQDLDSALRNADWAQRANIKTGAQYLLCWLACMLRDPFEPLPYLFFYGAQNSGKSIFHEACALLMTKGVAAADRALTNVNDFNGELANAVLCYVEEKDISVAGASAYNKIKDWVTSKMISIRRMRMDSYTQPNTTHWIQCANEIKACPVFPGDTRITMAFVPDLADGEEIPKKVLIQRLESEAPHFMRTLLDLTLPAVEGRLRLPVVKTANKERAEDNNRDPLQVFLEENCYEVRGATIPFVEFYEKFYATMTLEEASKWSKPTTIKSLPEKYPYGIKHSNIRCVGNIAWEPTEPEPGAKALVSYKGKLFAKKD